VHVRVLYVPVFAKKLTSVVIKLPAFVVRRYKYVSAKNLAGHIYFRGPPVVIRYIFSLGVFITH